MRRDGTRAVVSGPATLADARSLLEEGRAQLKSGVRAIDLAGVTELERLKQEEPNGRYLDYRQHVITSYSIHYTKLYERMSSTPYRRAMVTRPSGRPSTASVMFAARASRCQASSTARSEERNNFV